MRAPSLLVPISLGALLAAAPAGKTPPAAARPLYDPSTVTTVQGEVVRIVRVAPGRRGEGVHLLLRTAVQSIDVHLGPASFVDAQPMKLREGDVVEVTGSRLVLERKPTLIAREVRRDGERMALRDASGIPAWRRGGGR